MLSPELLQGVGLGVEAVRCYPRIMLRSHTAILAQPGTHGTR